MSLTTSPHWCRRLRTYLATLLLRFNVSLRMLFNFWASIPPVQRCVAPRCTRVLGWRSVKINRSGNYFRPNRLRVTIILILLLLGGACKLPDWVFEKVCVLWHCHCTLRLQVQEEISLVLGNGESIDKDTFKRSMKAHLGRLWSRQQAQLQGVY